MCFSCISKFCQSRILHLERSTLGIEMLVDALDNDLIGLAKDLEHLSNLVPILSRPYLDHIPLEYFPVLDGNLKRLIRLRPRNRVSPLGPVESRG